MRHLWEVVGGIDTGGIVVREGASLQSAHVCKRLTTGALVRELALTPAGRLQYELVEGKGPETGWVSTRTRAGPLVVKTQHGRLATPDAHCITAEEAGGVEAGTAPGAELAVVGPDTALPHLISRATASRPHPAGADLHHEALLSQEAARRRIAGADRIRLVDTQAFSLPYCSGDAIESFVAEFLEQDEDWGWCCDFQPKVFAQLAWEGFIPGGMTLPASVLQPAALGMQVQVLLPWCGASRSVLELQELHVPRRALRRAGGFALTVDRAFDAVLLECVQQHGDGQLCPALRELCRSLFRDSTTCPPGVEVEVHSMELWNEKGVLVAGEVGFSIGACYTAMTGFRRAGGVGGRCAFGEMQCVLAALLLRQLGFQLLDLGPPEPYKAALGARVLGRAEFRRRWQSARAAVGSARALREAPLPARADELLLLLGSSSSSSSDASLGRPGHPPPATGPAPPPAAPAPAPALDRPDPGLLGALGPQRARLEEQVARSLEAYDAGMDFPRREDFSCSHRNGFEAHLRAKGLKELRTQCRIFCRQRATRVRGQGDGGEEPLVILALLAAHIRSEGRARRLQHVLRSVTSQRLPDCAGVEVLVSVSWSASTPELEALVRETVGSHNIVAVSHKERLSQFQHLRAALEAAEAALRRRAPPPARARAGAGAAADREPSYWVLFGDDDDIWHPQRVAEYVAALRSHPMLVGVAVFATLNRANCSDSKATDAEMPRSSAEADAFLRAGRGYRVEETEPHAGWYQQLERAGALAGSMAVPQEVFLEYFDFCPRLRVVHEFFASASTTLLEHRYCDLCFGQFLRSYPTKGVEAGLELAFFRPRSWMYFYACTLLDETQWITSLEGDGAAAKTSTVGRDGHMSSEVAVSRMDVAMAEETLERFRAWEPAVCRSRLERYWAAFRGTVEVFLVPQHRSCVDQRLFDAFVAIGVNRSFGKFSQKTGASGECRRMLHDLGQGYAKQVAAALCVRVLWHQASTFMEPKWVKDSSSRSDASGPCRMLLFGADASSGGRESSATVVPQSHSKHGVSTFFWWG